MERLVSDIWFIPHAKLRLSIHGDCHVLGATKTVEWSTAGFLLKGERGFLRRGDDFSGEPFGAKV